MPQSSSIMMSVSHLHENGKNSVLKKNNATASVSPNDGTKQLVSKDVPQWLRNNAKDGHLRHRPGTRRGSLEPLGELCERSSYDPKVSKDRRRSLDMTLKTPRPGSASCRRRTAPDLDFNLVGATPAEVGIRNRTNVVDTLVFNSNAGFGTDSHRPVTSRGRTTSPVHHDQQSQASHSHRSMAIDCVDGLPGSIQQQCISNLAKQSIQPSRPKSAHHSRYRRPLLDSGDIKDVDVETLTLDDEITENMERPGSPTMVDRSATRMARPLTPPARPTITLDFPASTDEDWSSNDSDADAVREGSRSVLRVKRKHLRRRYSHKELEEYGEEGRQSHLSVHRTHSDGSSNLPANFRVENRSEVAERVVERYRRRAQSDVSTLEQVKHLFADNADIVVNAKHSITSNSKPRKLRPILQRSRETMMLGDGQPAKKDESTESSQPHKKTLQPMTHLSLPRTEQEGDVYPSPPNSADKISDQEFFNNDISPRSRKPLSDIGDDLGMKKSPFLSRSCPDTAVSS